MRAHATTHKSDPYPNPPRGEGEGTETSLNVCYAMGKMYEVIHLYVTGNTTGLYPPSSNYSLPSGRVREGGGLLLFILNILYDPLTYLFGAILLATLNLDLRSTDVSIQACIDSLADELAFFLQIEVLIQHSY